MANYPHSAPEKYAYLLCSRPVARAGQACFYRMAFRPATTARQPLVFQLRERSRTETPALARYALKQGRDRRSPPIVAILAQRVPAGALPMARKLLDNQDGSGIARDDA